MVRRQAATAATAERFRAKPFHFGAADCVRMVAFHLKKLGHKVALAKAGSYSSALGAKRALKRSGYSSLADALDRHGLERITPAAAMMGDILLLPSSDEFEALAVVLGNGRAIAYHAGVGPESGAVNIQPLEILAAWRVEPK